MNVIVRNPKHSHDSYEFFKRIEEQIKDTNNVVGVVVLKDDKIRTNISRNISLSKM